MPEKINNPLVSVVVPIYNVEAYVNKCIDSIIAQTYRNIEIILVNDGSTDHSRDLIEKYTIDSRCKIVDKENGGLSSARNAGIKESSGVYLYFVDSDDYILPNTIEQLVTIMQCKDADFCCYGFAFYSMSGVYRIYSKIKPISILGRDNILYDALLNIHITNTAWSKFFKASFLKENNILFNEGIINEDYLFTIECCLYAQKVVFLDKVLYNALMRPGSISRNFKKENITSYFEIDSRLSHLLFEDFKLDSLLDVYNASFIKNVLYALMQCAYNSKEYTSFKNLYKYLDGSKYKNNDVGRCVAKVGFKYYIMYKISLYKNLFYCVMKILKKCGLYMP